MLLSVVNLRQPCCQADGSGDDGGGHSGVAAVGRVVMERGTKTRTVVSGTSSASDPLDYVS